MAIGIIWGEIWSEAIWNTAIWAQEAGSDTTPDQFTFADRFNVATSTQITSDPVTITGIDAAADITVTGGEYNINGGAFTSSAGTAVNGDAIRARHTSSGSASTATNTVVTVGGVSDTFTSTTAGAANPSETGIISIIVRRNRLLQ